ncbi:anthranilate synthase component II [Paenibacillus sp. URB8-2]|uniref:anthranilate synthase component II n=1 Tax=Paenibacillus sp. URB8-2 TaxID=2741301 RepID=UPI0015BB914A|nr:aminodeoxychorismate/anthranilate synthase component II [Paenibacillus sp. URB8-2]BCG56871.1 glutamine amidotransferase [Paenibacillus sp. URB8-2]
MRAIVIDAYDSFVYIICQYLMEAGVHVDVVRNDQLDLPQIEYFAPDLIVLGPGPGHPAEARYVELIHQYSARIPTLGVCLGHQAIGLAFGGEIVRAEHLMHGKTSQIYHDGKGCFSDVESPFRATRYHSLLVSKEGFPDCLEITAQSEDDGYVMGLRHKVYPIESIQFHPESVYTEHGLVLFQNFIRKYVKSSLGTQLI